MERQEFLRKPSTGWWRWRILGLLGWIVVGMLRGQGQVDPPPADLYYPPASGWETADASQWGLKVAHFDSARAYHLAHEATAPRDQEWGQATTFGREPYGEGIGPFAERGEPTGLVVHRGKIVAAWGDPAAVEMTHSVTKSFLSALCGLAVERGRIGRLTDTVAADVAGVELYRPAAPGDPVGDLGQFPLYEPFATAHNRRITWEHLLRQTSDWEGTLWGKPDWADRPAGDLAAERARERHAPGEVWEYNDTRVNVLALAATMVWRQPLPQVLHREIMDPIGASTTWQWRGYRNSWIVLDGQPVQVVSGGGHWGGGMFISAYDLARFGLLMMRNGVWEDQQIIPPWLIEAARQPTAANPGYGYMNWFLNEDQLRLPAAPATAVVFLGNGTNAVYLDYEHDLVVVVRWIDRGALAGLIARVLRAWD